MANCFNDYFVFLVHIYYIRSCLSGLLSTQNPQTVFFSPVNSNEIQCILSGHSKQVQYLQVQKKFTRCTSAKEEKMYHSALNLHICSLISSLFAQMLRQCTWKLRLLGTFPKKPKAFMLGAVRIVHKIRPLKLSLYSLRTFSASIFIVDSENGCLITVLTIMPWQLLLT